MKNRSALACVPSFSLALLCLKVGSEDQPPRPPSIRPLFLGTRVAAYYSQPYVPTLWEWRLIQFQAASAATVFPGEHPVVTGFTVYSIPPKLLLLVQCNRFESQLLTKETFNSLAHRKQRAEYRKLGDQLFESLPRTMCGLQESLAEDAAKEAGISGHWILRPEHVEMQFLILGDGPFAKYKGGKIILRGEAGFEDEQ